MVAEHIDHDNIQSRKRVIDVYLILWKKSIYNLIITPCAYIPMHSIGCPWFSFLLKTNYWNTKCRSSFKIIIITHNDILLTFRENFVINSSNYQYYYTCTYIYMYIYIYINKNSRVSGCLTNIILYKYRPFVSYNNIEKKYENIWGRISPPNYVCKECSRKK